MCTSKGCGEGNFFPKVVFFLAKMCALVRGMVERGKLSKVVDGRRIQYLNELLDWLIYRDSDEGQHESLVDLTIY